MHFHLPDGSTFLRLQDPERYGEAPEQKSAAVQAVHSEQRFLSALEAGSNGFYFRLSQPIHYQGRYVGALEFGIRAEQLLNTLRKQLQKPVAFYYSADLWSQLKEGKTLHRLPLVTTWCPPATPPDRPACPVH